VHDMWVRLKKCANRFFETMAYADPMALYSWPIESAQPESAESRARSTRSTSR
jgi:hypothetical protein